MKLQDKINEIKIDLSFSKIDEVFKKMTELLKENSYLDEILLLSTRESELRKNIRLKLIGYDSASIEQNQINHALLEILNEFEHQLRELGKNQDGYNDQSYSRSIVNLGMDLEKGSRLISNSHDKNMLSELLLKISNLLELKITKIEKGEDLNQTLGKLELYKDYLPELLHRSKNVINESLSFKILSKINEAYRKKGQYITSINEGKLYDLSDKEKLLRELKIASGYFQQTAELLNL